MFSGMIRDAKTRKILLESNHTFLFPEHIFTEIHKHRNTLQNKSGLTTKEFDALLNILISRIHIVTTADLLTYKKQAIQIMQDIDIDDAPFVACALAHNATIWSDDKHLKQQSVVPVYTTKELITQATT